LIELGSPGEPFECVLLQFEMCGARREVDLAASGGGFASDQPADGA